MLHPKVTPNKWKLAENTVPVGAGLICIMHHPPTKNLFIISSDSTSGWRAAVRIAYMCANTIAGAPQNCKRHTSRLLKSVFVYHTELKWSQPPRLSTRLIISHTGVTHESHPLRDYYIAEVRSQLPSFSYSVIFCHPNAAEPTRPRSGG